MLCFVLQIHHVIVYKYNANTSEHSKEMGEIALMYQKDAEPIISFHLHTLHYNKQIHGSRRN